jgi:1-acyl-sn-glycerol-3-phosphate acyltransferase
MIIFPEGTTSDGTGIREFKSTLFNLPAEENIPVMPISIRYTGINGKPAVSGLLYEVAWYGDMELMPHLWNVLGLRSIDAVVHFSQPIPVLCGEDRAGNERKRLCTLAYKSVTEGFEACMYGH